MIDIHAHIIPGVDDGSKNINDTINILKNAKLAGFTGIVATPHYIEGSYIVNNKDKMKLIDDIKDEVIKQNIDIDIYIGNEVFITENIENLIYSKNISSINNSRYILIELPLAGETTILQNCIFRLFSLGYIPIIAHPERYHFVQKNPNKLIEYIDQGVLFQLNSGSLFGHYGKKAKKTSIILLKNNMIQFIATDVHSGNSSSYYRIAEVYDIISKLTNKNNADILLTKNPTDVVNNKKIIINEPREYKKGIFDLIYSLLKH